MITPNLLARWARGTAEILARASVAGLDQDPAAYPIKAVKGCLYFNQKDSLSINLIDNPSLGHLFNAPLGGGWTKSPSEETLVTIEITGKPGSYASRREIGLRVTKRDGTVILDHGPQIGTLSGSGKYHATLVVDGPGYDPLQLGAQVLGQPATAASALEKDIPFQCGE